ncbi:MAG: hypothetical protein WCW53_08865 [Syntrophales bacterium]|jgi:hypothetical protein
MKTAWRRKSVGMFLGTVLGMLSYTSILALTPDQVLALRKAGVSDRTIQLMIEQEQEAKQNPYDTMGTKEITDSAGNRYIIYSTGKSDQTWEASEKEKVDKAWQMLQGVIIDGRPK